MSQEVSEGVVSAAGSVIAAGILYATYYFFTQGD
jgi:hypothetical protein